MLLIKTGQRFTDLPAALVIDANVARAAGGEAANYPTSKLTRDCLQAVLGNSHELVMSPEITAEWNTHQSGFARRWRLSMTARRRIRRIESQFNAQLRIRLRAATNTAGEWDELEKDCILIEAALSSDRAIISLDDTARELFRVRSVRVGEIREVIWVNPARAEELVIEWIAAGCALANERTLGGYR